MIIKTGNIKSIHTLYIFHFFWLKKIEGFSDMSHTGWYQTGKETFIQAIKMVGKMNLTTLKQNTGRHFRRGER